MFLEVTFSFSLNADRAPQLKAAFDGFYFSRLPMNRDEIHQTISGFLALLEEPNVNSEAREEKLTLALDRLALAYHFSDCKFDEGEYPDAQRKDYDTLRQVVERVFPEYGKYNTPSEISSNAGEAEMYIGDAIEDIADIAGDMLEVLWLWENTSVEDALWHFRFGYESHWGLHLRCLQLYLLANRRDI